jgi:hypothetical protein
MPIGSCLEHQLSIHMRLNILLSQAAAAADLRNRQVVLHPAVAAVPVDTDNPQFL